MPCRQRSDVYKRQAYYMLEGIQPVISVAQNAIKDILNETQPVPVTIEKIVGEVSRTFNVSPVCSFPLDRSFH